MCPDKLDEYDLPPEIECGNRIELKAKSPQAAFDFGTNLG